MAMPKRPFKILLMNLNTFKMKYGKLIIEKGEYEIISDLLSKVDSNDPVRKAGYVTLREELSNADVKNSDEMPDDVVRLNSFIDIDTPMGHVEGYQLVMPADADPKEKRLSILTPMGSALIGYASGDEVIWSFPTGEKKIKIEKVYRGENHAKAKA